MGKGKLDSLQGHPVVSSTDWLAARVALLEKEKAFTRLREDLARERRALPWERVEKQYVLRGPGGEESLRDLFGAHSQLVVYHFMFDPQSAAGCPHCSFWADHYDGMLAHLDHRDVSFVVISRAPLDKIEAFRTRMGWRFKWLSSGDTDFNYDYQASFRTAALAGGSVFYNYKQSPSGPPDREGISVFYKDDTDAVFHTYSCYARGIDMVNATYQFLDLVPKGRNEDPDDSQSWVRYHDRY
jgi:predicted dithiol-disulfide oxidoreductase (DUF899 family)